MIDQYFTPEHIASNLLNSLNIKDIKSIADFSIGDGSLVKNLPFKASKVIGLDIDVDVINQLKESNSTWDLKTGDFLNPDKETSTWLATYYNKLDLVVLNPPFSCKGKKRITIKVSENHSLLCRTSLAFLFNASKYLNKNGILIAIIPLSCVKSEADNLVLSYLKNFWDITFGQQFGREVFKGCNPNSIVITLKPKLTIYDIPVFNAITKFSFKAQILRGSTQMHTVLDAGRFRVLHTTNLQDNLIKNVFKYTNDEKKCANGTFLCIPRVGKPLLGKVILVQNSNFILSDCIIGIRGENLDQTLFIKRCITSNWENFKKMYDSTCAPYITINQIKEFLKSFKIYSEIVLNFENTNAKKDELINKNVGSNDKNIAPRIPVSEYA